MIHNVWEIEVGVFPIVVQVNFVNFIADILTTHDISFSVDSYHIITCIYIYRISVSMICSHNVINSTGKQCPVLDIFHSNATSLNEVVYPNDVTVECIWGYQLENLETSYVTMCNSSGLWQSVYQCYG